MIEFKTFDSSFLPFLTYIIGPTLASVQLSLICFSAGINIVRNPAIICYGIEDSKVSASPTYQTQYCLLNSLWVGIEDEPDTHEDVR